MASHRHPSKRNRHTFYTTRSVISHRFKELNGNTSTLSLNKSTPKGVGCQKETPHGCPIVRLTIQSQLCKCTVNENSNNRTKVIRRMSEVPKPEVKAGLMNRIVIRPYHFKRSAPVFDS